MAFIVKKKVLIDGIQRQLLSVEILHFVLVAAIFLACIFVPIVIQLYSGDLASPEVQDAARRFLVLHGTIWLPLLLALAFVSLHNLAISHRIVGPLYQIRPTVDDIGDGDLSRRIKNRPEDDMTRDADAMNETMNDLEGKLRRMGDEWSAARHALGRLRSAEGDPARAKEAMAEISRTIETGERLMGELKMADSSHAKDREAPANPVHVKT